MTVSLEILNSLLRGVQAEQRAVRTRLDYLEDQIDSLVTREEARKMMRATLRHMSAVEAGIEARFDAIDVRFDALITRFDNLEALIRGEK